MNQPPVPLTLPTLKPCPWCKLPPKLTVNNYGEALLIHKPRDAQSGASCLLPNFVASIGAGALELAQRWNDGLP